jgi:hypothetical protein
MLQATIKWHVDRVLAAVLPTCIGAQPGRTQEGGAT